MTKLTAAMYAYGAYLDILGEGAEPLKVGG